MTAGAAIAANAAATVTSAAVTITNDKSHHGVDEKDRMRQFITNKRLMLSLADAGGRMMYSIKDLAELAGYTSRVFTLLSTLHRVQAQAYGQRNKYKLEDSKSQRNSIWGTQPQTLPQEQKSKHRHRVALYSLEDVKGTTQEGYEGVRFEHTPIVVPGLGRDLSPGEILVKDLNIVINPGEHLLISGLMARENLQLPEC